MNTEIRNHLKRGARVVFFAVLASLLVWRANCYVDPRGFTGLPQVFLCLMALCCGLIAFSIGLGHGEPDPELE